MTHSTRWNRFFIRPFSLALSLSLLLSPLQLQAGWLDWFSSKKETSAPELIKPIPPTPLEKQKSDLKVVSVAPSGAFEGFEEVNSIIVTFDRPIVALKALDDSKKDFLRIEPEFPGKYRWLGTQTLAFETEGGLPFGSRVKVTIPAGTAAQDGAKLDEDFTWTFDTARPELFTSQPYNGTTHTSLKPQFELHFNQPMDPKRLNNYVVLKGKSINSDSDLEELMEPPLSAYPETIPLKFRSPTKEEFTQYQWRSNKKESLVIAVPKKTLKREYAYVLVLKNGLPGAQGNLGLAQEEKIYFETYKTFHVEGVPDQIHPQEGLEIRFSNPVQVSDVSKFISFDPPLALPKELDDYHYDTEYVHLTLPVEARKKYVLTIKKGLKDKFGQKLKSDFKAEFETTSYVPYLSMPQGQLVVEATQKKALPMSVINMASARTLLQPLTAAEAIPSLIKEYWQEEIIFDKKRALAKTRKFKLERDKSAILPFELKPALNNKGFGFLFASLKALSALPGLGFYPLDFFDPKNKVAFVQVTNLAITAKCAPERNLVWVTTLDKAKPVSGAKVTLYTDEGKALWNGQTNAKGQVLTPGWGSLGLTERPGQWGSDSPRVWFVAEKDGDKAMVASNWGTGIYPYQFDLPYEYQQTFPEYGGHIFTDRGLYRAGEETHIKGVFRQWKDGKWTIPDLKELLVEIQDSRGEKIFSDIKKLNAFGSFSQKIALKPNAASGFYSITAKEIVLPKKLKPGASDKNDRSAINRLSSYGSFQVEAYRPAKFETTVRLDKESYIKGEKAEASLKGWYLFGAPMKNAPFEIGAHITKFYFTPKGYEGYFFDPIDYYYDYKKYDASWFPAGNKKGELTDQGEATFTANLDAQTILGPARVTMQGVITDKDREKIAGSADAIIHPASFYLGIKPSTAFIEKEKPIDLSVITVTPEGKILPGKEATVEISRVEWRSVRKAGVGGRTFWVSEKTSNKLKSFDIVTSSVPVQVSFTPEQAGFYTIHGETRDDEGRETFADGYFYASGKDYVAWERGDTDIIDLVKDKDVYKPKDVAKIMVKSPYEKAIALVSVEQDGVLKSFNREVEGSADVISIPIEDNFAPNVYVSVILLQGRTKEGEFSEDGVDVGKPGFKIGYAELNVESPWKRLTVEVKTNKEEYRPGQKVRLEFQVKNHLGKPAAAECVVSVANRGILDLIGYNTPNSYHVFYGDKPLSVQTVESRLHVIGQRHYGEKGENRGGGGMARALASDAAFGDGLNLRQKFKGTAYYNAAVLTDKNGKGSIEFTLPDDITTFKAMVTAQTANARFGAGDSEFLVKKPLLIKPSVPRFARLGDAFEAGVVVHNLTKKDGTATVSIKSDILTLTGEKTKSIEIKDGEAREVRFSFEAKNLGEDFVTVSARLGQESDGIKIPLPIILPRLTETVGFYDHVEKTKTETVEVPTDVYEGVGHIEIQGASTAMVGLKEGVRFLQAYPYECLEQKISRVLPFLLSEDVLSAFGLNQLEGKARAKVVKKMLTDLEEFQGPDGGFKYWPDSRFSHEFLTAYVMFFLSEAKKDGFTPDPKLVSRAVKYMKAVLRRPDNKTWSYPYAENARLSVKAFTVYALALWGEKEPAYIQRLREEKNQIPFFGRALLLKAMTLNGTPANQRQEMAASLMNGIRLDPARAHFEENNPEGLDWIFYSPVRTTAFALQAFLETGTDFPHAAKTVRWLMDERKQGRWRTTQENLYVFYALSDYFRKYEKEDPNFTAQVQVGAKTAFKELFKGRDVSVKTKKMALSEFPSGKELPTEFSKNGPGRFYYGFRMTYAPKGELKERSEGLSITRETTLLDGKPLPNPLPAGTQVLVTLTVQTPFDRTYVAVEDWLPAGFKIENASFKTTANPRFQEEQVNSSRSWYSGFNRTEIYDDRFLAFSDYLRKGTHTTRYQATALTPGVFERPPAKVEGMYTPEVFGRTGSEKIIIE